MPRIYLFLSSGRCGTQWLASNLAAAYSDEAVVAHEPLGAGYRPRDFLRAYDRLDDMLAIEPIRNHLDDVGRIIEERTYIETGWPSYAAIPLFVRRFGDDVALVRVIRHPVPTAMSLVTHGFWSGRADEFATKAILDPWCHGIALSGYAERWREMSPYEKCLFWWTEVHLYADELRSRYPSIPFHDVRFEDLFATETSALQHFISFLGMPERDALRAATERRTDDHQHRSAVSFDWWEIFDHVNTLAVAERHGYKVRWSDARDLRRRYRVTAPSWRRRGARAARWVRARARSSS